MYFLVLVLLSACNKDIVVPLPDQKISGPVVECILSTDSTHKIYYSKVVAISEPFKPLTDANIFLETRLKRSSKSAYSSPGIFTVSKFPLNPRDTVTFELTSSTDTISLTEVMPSSIAFTKTDTSKQAVAGIGITQLFTIQFRDSAIDQNYYRLSAKRQFRKYTLNTVGLPIDSSTEWQPLKIDGNEAPFLRNNFNNYTEQEILFSDEIFNGVLSTFTFHNLIPFKNSLNEKTLSVIITLENLNFSAYQYYNTRAEHLWSQKSITQTPGPVQSNIPNGYGVVGAKTQTNWEVVYAR